MKFMLLIVLVFKTNGDQCDCTTANINNDYSFIPSNCSVKTNTICFVSDYAFDNDDRYFYNFIILKNTTLYSTIDIGFWFDTQSFTIDSNVLFFLMTNLHINNKFVIETNAVINVLQNSTNFGRMSIAGNLVLINPELNNPRIVLWNSTYLHLNLNMTPRPDFQIENPTGNTNCFDVISLNNNSNIDTSDKANHITSDMFKYSYNFTYGKGYLISNKKLMRFCPKDTQLNNEVVCTLKNVYYNFNSPTNMSMAYDYPHCPCNSDDEVICKLKFIDGINDFNMLKYILNNTELLIDRDMRLLNLNFAKQVTIYDNVELTVNSLFTNLIFSFTFGKIVTNSKKDEYTNASFIYLLSTDTVTCVGDLNYIFSIFKNITTLNIDCNGAIEKLYLYENTNVYILKNTILNKINQVDFTENGKSFVFIENSNNNKALSNCHLMEVSKTGLKCLVCDSKYRLDNNICNSLVDNCETYNKNNICVLCKTGYILNEKFECANSANCLYGTTSECYKCPNQYIRYDNECIYNDKCLYTDESICFKCITGNSYNKCNNCASNCNLCLNQKCTLCNEKHVLNNESVCVEEKNGVSTGISTIWCNDEFYIDNGICNKCSSNFANSYNCDKVHAISCEVNYSISDARKCNLSNCQNGTFKEQNGMCIFSQNKCIFIVNDYCVECENNYKLDNNKTCVNITNDTLLSGCVLYSKSGCISCDIGYYLSNAVCFQCSENCTSCFESDRKCLTCKYGFYQGKDYTCLSSTKLIEKCDKISQITGGCYKCNDGYYRVGMDCVECLSNCSICNTKYMCLTCNSTNYKTTSGKCLPQNSIIGCFSEVTQNGCSKCQDGYYTINNNECEKCNDNCTTCTQHEKCTFCVKSKILFESGLCLDISYVSKCLEIFDSKCSKCTFWHSPNKSGTLCNKKAVWWVLIIIVLLAILLLTMAILLIIFAVLYIEKKVRQKEIEMTTTLFKMSRSNITFIQLGDDVVVNKTEISFGEDIDVNLQQRELLCVGNTSKHNMKIQITTKSATIEKYKFDSNPKVVVLPSGEACEFEILLTLNCTTKIDENIVLVANSFTHKNNVIKNMKITATSKLTTRLDPDELKKDKKLGEGSFGVVFKGTFRDNNVAIKKMKICENNGSQNIEFEKEVAMLDKFRSEYIVHFYGAVFIPNKICMVTEFAQFGSLQDLMKHKKSGEVNIKLRLKFLLDGAKGIQYLHENGILHRDIKPDNILVFSLDWKDKVIAKLTDFGSARNVNLLMTNMTFTNGIGTPKYMAPEILNKEHYKKPADVFSFAITMLECFLWSNAYPKSVYMYPWTIADDVASGKRPKEIKTLDKKYQSVIEKCWKQKVEERITINEVIDILKTID
ncbi:protein serine/threonine kinase, putative [Entamoeba invadens IP1]|uniref:Protein serine/threonine kinase, putative n=1 Tax=Entamoeba invadens IP1 TaxID=370355 RepID=A0A0A1U9P5_ENTIV|nr:protein serine/threonine kinase, putative [Entamoeba invadens IP1]ELP91752.1 protein serine/threonine kinase, putative [Entamoeba invadens IP1]|eukprot:XP_004258523.1 protein serine/threonine kinase, putative [Entamoeba invadens IP1]